MKIRKPSYNTTALFFCFFHCLKYCLNWLIYERDEGVHDGKWQRKFHVTKNFQVLNVLKAFFLLCDSFIVQTWRKFVRAVSIQVANMDQHGLIVLKA